MIPYFKTEILAIRDDFVTQGHEGLNGRITLINKFTHYNNSPEQAFHPTFGAKFFIIIHPLLFFL